MQKKNILVFTLSPPLPASAGGPIYVMNTLAPLIDEYDFHLFTIGGEEEKKKIEANRQLYDRHFKSVHVEPRAKMPAEKGTLGRALHSLVHCFHGLPFMDASYFSVQAIQSARRIIKEKKIDLLEVHSSHLAFFRKFFPDLPAVLVSHNIESDLFPFWIPGHLKGWQKAAVTRIAEISRRNAQRVEIDNAWHFDAMTFISREDMDRVTAPVEKHYVPLCFPVKEVDYRKKPTDELNLLWMGGFWWYPNAEGVAWFVRDILPLVRDKLKKHNIKLHFTGGNPPDDLKALHDGQHIFVHGFVPSLAPILADAHLLFVPLLSGGGVRVKILEAMSNGIPVLSTTKGCEGLGAVNRRDLVICDSAAEFADAIIELAQNRELLATLSANARQLLKDKYDLDACVRVKRDLYNRLMQSR
ncbi:group 1 glycosyl transferase [Burkholderia multivorans]|uniref:Group 1 glycosyl transferase n=3 Tax=Burkholderia multivorans TaxID=87883 RepID=A0ABD7LQ38_9BURK|nr:glycosyltransferase family 4 protein [Burkholderia multivorans]SAK21712.1 group 1 glycosyl transferase [Burkholderia multivorans]